MHITIEKIVMCTYITILVNCLLHAVITAKLVYAKQAVVSAPFMGVSVMTNVVHTNS